VSASESEYEPVLESATGAGDRDDPATTYTDPAASSLGGIGVTISFFVTERAFAAVPVADNARVGILLGSVVAGGMGYLLPRAVLPPERVPEAGTATASVFAAAAATGSE
jgi:hypothetical protein